MPYARTTYTLKDIQLGFRDLDTNRTQGNQGGKFGSQPAPHGTIHGAEGLYSHPLFAKARVLAGDGPGTHSVMDQTQMFTALVGVMNDANMQPFLATVDGGNDAHVNVNLNATPGNADVYKANKVGGGATTTNGAVLAFFIKVRPNPGNADVPIIQTCVPRTTAFNPGDLLTKKGVVKGFTH